MKKIRSAAIITAAIMSASVLSGCSSQESNGTTTVSMLLSDSASAPFNKDWEVLKEIKNRKNVEMDVQVVPASEYATKRSIVMSSGEIPDILTNTWANQVGQYATGGLLLPVSDYLDKMPNLKKIIDEWDLAETVEDITEMDGKFYVLPAFEKDVAAPHGLAIRKDIFDKHGIAVPETYEDLHKALLKLKELYPDSLGLGDMYSGNLLLSFTASSFGTKGGYSLPYGYAYDYDKKEWYFAPTSAEYKSMLEYLNSLYVDGCLDPEAFTQDNGQFKKKVLNEKYFVVPAFGQSAVDGYDSELQGLGVEGADFEMLYPLAGPTGIRKGKPCGHYAGGLAMPATVAERKDFDKVLEFVDWLYYSEECALMSTIGVEGVTYTKDGDNYKLNDDIKTINNLAGTKELAKDFGFGTIGFTSIVLEKAPKQARELITSKEEEERKMYMIEHDMVDKDDPTIKFTQEQSEDAKLLYTNLNDYTKTMMLKFIYGEESFDKWDAYVKKCKELGSDELIDMVKKAWKENNKK